jgi:hypothetical protein
MEGSQMLGKLLPVMLAAFLIFAGMRAGRSSSANLQSQQPLEVFITELLQWKNGCLQVSIDRVNRSSNPIFLPGSGLYISSSATTAVPPSGHNIEISWFPVYGASDLLDLSATPLAPGETKHNDTCVGPTFFVTNLKKETRREVQVRGQLRIDASYFLSEQDWLTNKSEREEMLRTAPDKWPKPLQPEVATVIMSIPCYESPCKASCDGPPIVLDGEVMIVPDVGSFERESNERGRAINEELAKRFSPCPAP